MLDQFVFATSRPLLRRISVAHKTCSVTSLSVKPMEEKNNITYKITWNNKLQMCQTMNSYMGSKSCSMPMLCPISCTTTSAVLITLSRFSLIDVAYCLDKHIVPKYAIPIVPKNCWSLQRYTYKSAETGLLLVIDLIVLPNKEPVAVQVPLYCVNEPTF